jgi:hypothetical protein
LKSQSYDMFQLSKLVFALLRLKYIPAPVTAAVKHICVSCLHVVCSQSARDMLWILYQLIFFGNLEGVSTFRVGVMNEDSNLGRR